MSWLWATAEDWFFGGDTQLSAAGVGFKYDELNKGLNEVLLPLLERIQYVDNKVLIVSVREESTIWPCAKTKRVTCTLSSHMRHNSFL